MNLQIKLDALERIYLRFDKYSRALNVACKKYCAHCCTCNLSMTSLEAFYIYRNLEPRKQADIRESAARAASGKRYIPELTWNQMAKMCAEGKEPPEEDPDPNWGACPLLDNAACPIYECRPFGCRCMLSTCDCGQSGCAEIDDYTITVSTVFLQFIEHLDQGGVFGNFSDVLAACGPAASAAGTGALYPPLSGQAAGSRLPANQPIPVLLVPPEQQTDICSLVNDLHAIVAPALKPA
ncbi:MAG: hypothetical protein R6X08_11760 [Desulfosalsimonadaceae bacterium]